MLYTVHYTVNDLTGVFKLRTEKDKNEAQAVTQRLVVRAFGTVGISIPTHLINVTSCTTTEESVPKEEQELGELSAGVYQFVRWDFSGGPGPWHMLFSSNDAGGTICRTNRDFAKVKGRESGQEYPEGKYCSACHKHWAKLERERKAAEKAAQKAIKGVRKKKAA